MKTVHVLPRMTSEPYRDPTEIEREFLRVVTFGNPELERQIASCEIAEYDRTGWCDVNVLDGPSSTAGMADGPRLFFDVARNGAADAIPDMSTPNLTAFPVEIILWINAAGLLYTVEVVSYGFELIDDPYRVFVEAARAWPKRLIYPSEERQ